MMYKIYRIYLNRDESKAYIGVTRQSQLRYCLSDHKRKSKLSVEYKKCKRLYEGMIEEGIENYKIELIEKVEIKDKDELNLKLNNYIREKETKDKGYNK